MQNLVSFQELVDVGKMDIIAACMVLSMARNSS